jgi:hypothetical protein
MKTITIAREFFCYAAKLPYLDGCPDFVKAGYCIAVVQHGEATYICSLTPNSRVYELRNEFTCFERDSEKLREWLDTNDGAEWECGALSPVDYYGYIKHDESSPLMSGLVEFSDDFEVEESFDPENDSLPDDVSDSLWEAAIEYFQGNWHTPDCCGYLPNPETSNTESANV